MARKQPAQLEDPNIIERHSCVEGEIALVRREADWVEIQFITPAPEGQWDRKALLSFQLCGNSRHRRAQIERIAGRMMDVQCGICTAQHAVRGTLKLAA